MQIHSDKCQITSDSTVVKDLVVFKALTCVSRFLHLEQFTVIKNSLNELDKLPAMDFDEHHVFPKAENEKSYNWSILAYSVFWTKRLAGRSPFRQQVISVATDTPLMLELCECPSLIPYVFSFYLIFHLDCFLDQSYIIKFVFQVNICIYMSQLIY